LSHYLFFHLRVRDGEHDARFIESAFGGHSCTESVETCMGYGLQYRPSALADTLHTPAYDPPRHRRRIKQRKRSWIFLFFSAFMQVALTGALYVRVRYVVRARFTVRAHSF
jgi:hypothetical protein